MSFALADLAVPILGAPMAGGPGTPALAAAVSNAGGLGFLAAGYLTAERLADDMAGARSDTSGPIGVNLFVPQPDTASRDEIVRYRNRLVARYGDAVGAPRWDDDAWADKLEVIADLRPEVVSFTFAAPEPAVIARLRGAGVLTLMSVTSAQEARAAVALGVDGLVVQGPEAGGHRASWTEARPPEQPLDQLLAEVRQIADIPIVAAGGLGSAADVDAVLRVGASAAQVGTALLLSDEAGTNPVHRAALTSGDFTETVVTRAFSGRYARGLNNEFIRRFDDRAPGGYPTVHYLTAPLRRAAVAAGDPHGTNLWAGTSFATATAGTVAEVLAALV